MPKNSAPPKCAMNSQRQPSCHTECVWLNFYIKHWIRMYYITYAYYEADLKSYLSFFAFFYVFLIYSGLLFHCCGDAGDFLTLLEYLSIFVWLCVLCVMTIWYPLLCSFLVGKKIVLSDLVLSRNKVKRRKRNDKMNWIYFIFVTNINLIKHKYYNNKCWIYSDIITTFYKEVVFFIGWVGYNNN